MADFHCPVCSEQYELKSQKTALGARIVDGAYRTMLERLSSASNPNLFILNYGLSPISVLNLLVIPKQFFISDIVEPRKPLSDTARRAGWVGCNILLEAVPAAGKIFLIRDRVVRPAVEVLESWRQTLFLRDQGDTAARKWLVSIMQCIDRLDAQTFSLADIYRFEPALQSMYPRNQNVRAKIRQQLQVLREHGYLAFTGRGTYAVRPASSGQEPRR